MDQYIGITGISSWDEAERVMNTIDPDEILLQNEAGIKIMLGTLVSLKTMGGLRNKYYNKFPGPGEFSEICLDDERVMNCVHLCHGDALEDQILELWMFELCELFGDNLDAIQLNMPPPDPSKIENFKKQCNSVKVILQVTPLHGEFAEMSAQSIAGTMKFHFDKVIDKFLIDFSRGFGKQLDPDLARQLIEAFEKAGIKSSKIAIAGGLTADNPSLIEPIIMDYPMISLDTETGVRDNPEIGGGFLNLYKVRKFARSNICAFCNAKNATQSEPDEDDDWGKKSIIDSDDVINRDNQLHVDTSQEDESAVESVEEEAENFTVRALPEETDDPPTWTDFDGQNK